MIDSSTKKEAPSNGPVLGYGQDHTTEEIFSVVTDERGPTHKPSTRVSVWPLSHTLPALSTSTFVVTKGISLIVGRVRCALVNAEFASDRRTVSQAPPSSACSPFSAHSHTFHHLRLAFVTWIRSDLSSLVLTCICNHALHPPIVVLLAQFLSDIFSFSSHNVVYFSDTPFHLPRPLIVCIYTHDSKRRHKNGRKTASVTYVSRRFISTLSRHFLSRSRPFSKKCKYLNERFSMNKLGRQ
jgi:hypothetical protein